MEKAKIIKASGEVIEVTPKNGTDFSLKEMQDVVGGLIETIGTPDGKKIMVLNEEGKLDGLPLNITATKIAWKKFKLVDDWIAGDVLLCPAEMVK